MPDLIIKIKIKADKVQDFKNAFKRAVNRPTELTGMSDVAFLKYYFKNSFQNIYRTGKINIARETTPPIIDDNIIDVE